MAAESLGIGDCQFPIADLRLNSIGNRQSQIGNVQRPLEPDTVNTVEARNSQTLTVPSFLILGGAVFVFVMSKMEHIMSAAIKPKESEPGAVATGLNSLRRPHEHSR